MRTLARLKEWIARAHEAGVVAIDTETTSLDAMQAGLCGFSLAVAPNEACYVPLAHREGGGEAGTDLFAPEAKLCEGQIAEQDALGLLKPLLGRQGGAQDRAEPEIRLAGVRPARHRDARASTTPC